FPVSTPSIVTLAPEGYEVTFREPLGFCALAGTQTALRKRRRPSTVKVFIDALRLQRGRAADHADRLSALNQRLGTSVIYSKRTGPRDRTHHRAARPIWVHAQRFLNSPVDTAFRSLAYSPAMRALLIPAALAAALAALGSTLTAQDLSFAEMRW